MESVVCIVFNIFTLKNKYKFNIITLVHLKSGGVSFFFFFIFHLDLFSFHFMCIIPTLNALPDSYAVWLVRCMVFSMRLGQMFCV